MVSRTARRGVHCRARLEAAHSADLLSRPDLEGEGTGSQTEDGVGAIIERVEVGDSAKLDPVEAGTEEISWELAQQQVAQIVSEQRKHMSIQDLKKKIK